MDEITVEAKIENIDSVQDFVGARIADCPMKIQNQIGIVIDEIFSNIVRYAYNQPALASGDALVARSAPRGDVRTERLTPCGSTPSERLSPETGSVTVRVAVNDSVCIEFLDGGVAYDPLSSDEPDITLSAEEREVGGLGLFMVRNLMDSVEYCRAEGKNVLTVKKRIV
jgi:anti-sigma regulatory factor (Ser/Thr protein kinase)